MNEVVQVEQRIGLPGRAAAERCHIVVSLPGCHRGFLREFEIEWVAVSMVGFGPEMYQSGSAITPADSEFRRANLKRPAKPLLMRFGKCDKLLQTFVQPQRMRRPCLLTPAQR